MDETEIIVCATCADRGLLNLPVADGHEEHPCPSCRPWGQGFGGLYARKGRVLICLIHPAAPNEQAVKHTSEEQHESVNK